MLLCWLISSLTEAVLAHVVRLTTSRDVLCSLERIFASPSRARVQQLKYQVYTFKMGTSSMSKYIQSIKSIMDNLTAVGNPVVDSDLVSTLLSGLSPEYDSFVTSVNTQAVLYYQKNLSASCLARRFIVGMLSLHLHPQPSSPILLRFTRHLALQVTIHLHLLSVVMNGAEAGSAAVVMVVDIPSHHHISLLVANLNAICNHFGHYANQCYNRYNNLCNTPLPEYVLSCIFIFFDHIL